MDIRYLTLRGEEELREYRLPVSGFIYVVSGHATINLDLTAYRVKPQQLLHGGKGMHLAIVPNDELFAYYLILYKASLSSPHNRYMRRLYEATAPFETQYSCSLSSAPLLQGYLTDMIHHWQQAMPLDKLRVKALFYQFIYELMRMVTEQEVSGNHPDLVGQTVRYLQEHYRDSVTMDDLVAMLNCSPTHLSRLFKQRMGTSPIHYHIRIRMEHAKKLLLDSEASLKDIAASVGYSDVFYFSRMFKKHTDFSPLHFRNQFAGTELVPYSPLNKVASAMDSEKLSCYIDNNNYYQYKKGEKQAMKMYAKPSFLTMSILLSLALVLSACQPAATNTTMSSGNTAKSATVQPTQTPVEASASESTTKVTPATRMYKHIDGETEIPTNPKRIFTDLKVGQLMALGVKPVGSATWPLRAGFIDTTGIEDLGAFPLNLEKLTSLEPDLIILTEAWRDGGGYEAFSKIAPTIVIPNYGEDMSSELLMFGEMLGREKEAKQWLSEFEAKAAKSREKVNAVIREGETFSILNVRADNFYIYGNDNMGGGIIYSILGLKPQDKVKQDVIQGEVWEVSAEVIPEYIGDHLFIASNKSAEEALKNNQKIWANTRAVQNNNVYAIDFDQFLPSDPISTSHQLDIITDLLVKKHAK
ncbi:AraC family transcriptional regulator [Paenibacillus eucommiae]|uniref:Iron complex transport system substrate-binding protein n=1 Tax=Paenibacillus eucommiae TaxID=1355755 RepID=A0ABS4IXM7_9BACL|nr:AraC family transcriptional regulator [Paenibacillus eucommiae]MBP1991646.1 iron complex transport system substrate-binding protein [Paenibacillus eucommiae]